MSFKITCAAVPPLADINVAVEASDCDPSFTTNQPLVESIKTNVTETPSVSIVALTVEPPILSEPF